MSVLTRETVEVDSPQQVEKLNAVLWKFGEVLVDHFKCALEDILHNDGNLVLHQTLKLVSARL